MKREIVEKAKEIALKHCKSIAEYLGPDLEGQLYFYLWQDILEALTEIYKRGRKDERKKILKHIKGIDPLEFFADGESSDDIAFKVQESIVETIEKLK